MSLARNAAFNFLGAAAPALLNLATIPFIVASLGPADFGMLMLVTAVVGYFSLLDINVTAGSTKFVAQFNAQGDAVRVNGTATFGLFIYAVIGVVGMVGIAASAEWLAQALFAIPADRLPNAILAIQMGAVGFLTGQVQAYLQSLPGALMRYDVSGRIEASFGSLLPLLTVATLALGGGLVHVVALRVAMSVVQGAVLVIALRQLLPRWRPTWPDAALRRQVLGFSAYAFLSRLAAVTYAHADKLLIGARVGAVAVAFYSVPATLANRVMALVFRLSGVMFPHASALAGAGRSLELQRHYLLASRYMFYANGGIALLLAWLAEPILAQWLGDQFARQGSRVMVLIALAQWVDSMTNLPSLVNDGLGHAQVTGVFAISRAVIGLCFIWVGISLAGIDGAAGGHLLASVLMSGLFLAWVHGRTLPVRFAAVLRGAWLAPLCALGPAVAWMAAMRSHADSLAGLLAVGLAAVLVLAASGWQWVLTPEHRHRLRQHVAGRLGR